MSENVIYSKGIVPRGESFRQAQKLKGEIYNFIKQTTEETTESVFEKAGYKVNTRYAGEYGDGKVYGTGADNDKVSVKVGGKTDTLLQKTIYFGGKRMIIDIHISYKPEANMIEFSYKTTEDGSFRGFDEFKDGMMINEKYVLSTKDMSKFKKEMKDTLKGFAEKELSFMTKTKLGIEDKIEKSTASMVQEEKITKETQTMKKSENNKFSLMDMFNSTPEEFEQKIMENKNKKEKDLLLGDEQVEEGKERLSSKDVEAMLKDNNREYGTNFALRGAYGQWELWDEHGGNRIESGSIQDVKNAFIKNKLKEKYRKETNEITSTATAGGFAYNGPLMMKKFRRKMNESEEVDNVELRTMLEKLKQHLNPEIVFEIMEIGKEKSTMVSPNGSSSYLEDCGKIKIENKHYKAYLTDENKIWIQNFPDINHYIGTEGTPEEVAQIINKHYSYKMNESKIKDTAYHHRQSETEKNTYQRPYLNEDGFWTVVPQDVLDGYKKDHILGAPGAEGVEVNSKEEEEYNSGGIQKFPGGRAKKKEKIDESQDDHLWRMNEFTKRYIKKAESPIVVHEDKNNKILFVFENADRDIVNLDSYFSLMETETAMSLMNGGYQGKLLNGHLAKAQLTNESVSKRFKPAHELSNEELKDTWKKLSLHETYSTIKKAEEKEILKESKKPLSSSEKGLKELSRNNNLYEGDVIDGKKVISVRKKNCLAPVEYKVFEQDYLNESKIFIWDFNTGTLVRNPSTI